MHPRTVFQVGVEPNRVDIVMGLTGVRFDTAWARRTHATYADQRVSVIAREDLVRNKSRIGRPQDELDLVALRSAGRPPERKRRRRKKRRA